MIAGRAAAGGLEAAVATDEPAAERVPELPPGGRIARERQVLPVVRRRSGDRGIAWRRGRRQHRDARAGTLAAQDRDRIEIGGARLARCAVEVAPERVGDRVRVQRREEQGAPAGRRRPRAQEPVRVLARQREVQRDDDRERDQIEPEARTPPRTPQSLDADVSSRVVGGW